MNSSITGIVGLGNPGPRFTKTRHNIGFMVLDALADAFGGHFAQQGNAEVAQITINDKPVWLFKPQTFMNNSGQIVPLLNKKGIKAQNLLVVHDELELPFGSIKLKTGGSAKGHNGLRSFIATLGPDFMRLRIGIDRPANREEVPDYVLAPFKESVDQLVHVIDQAIMTIKTLF